MLQKKTSLSSSVKKTFFSPKDFRKHKTCLSYVCCPHLGPPQTRCLGTNRSKTGVSCLRNTHCSPVGSSAFESTNCSANLIKIFVVKLLFVSVISTEKNCISMICRHLSEIKFTLFFV